MTQYFNDSHRMMALKIEILYYMVFVCNPSYLFCESSRNNHTTVGRYVESDTKTSAKWSFILQLRYNADNDKF